MNLAQPQAVRTIFRLPRPEAIGRQFRADGVVRIRHGVTPAGRRYFASILERGQTRRFRRDIAMPQSQGSPRHMSVVGGEATNQMTDLIDLYRSPALLEWCSRVSGFAVEECPSPIENLILTILHHPGDTHGWHRDDYPLAFISVLETALAGGDLEIKRGRRTVPVPLSPGDVYLMQSDRLPHRVTPIREGGERVIVNFTYARTGVTVDPNGSADQLCAEHPTRPLVELARSPNNG